MEHTLRVREAEMALKEALAEEQANQVSSQKALAPVERSARETLTGRLRSKQDELVAALSVLRESERIIQDMPEHTLRDTLRLIDGLAMPLV